MAGAAALAWLRAATARRAVTLLTSLVTLAALGFMAGATSSAPPLLLQLVDHSLGLEGPWHVRARIWREPEPAAAGSTLLLRVDQVRVDGRWRNWPGRVQVRVPEPAAVDWSRGAKVDTFLRLRRDRPPANPGEWQRQRLMIAGIDARASLKSYRQLRQIAPANSALGAVPGRVRDRVRTVAARYFTHAELVGALLLGERAGIADEINTAMVDAGLIHLLAISGLHMGLLVALAVGVARVMGASPRAALGAGLIAVVIALVLVAPRPPILRAATMAAAVLGGKWLGRKVTALDALALAAFVLTLLDPPATHDFGFQLSVAATLGLLLLVPSSKRRSYVPALIGASIAAQVAVAPLLVIASHQIALGGLVLNVVAIPLMAVLLPIVIGTIGTGAVGLPAVPGLLAAVADRLIEALLWIATLAASHRWTTVTIPHLTWGWAAVYWLGLASTVAPARRAGAVGILVVATAVAATVLTRPSPPGAELVAIDVGQGDALLWRSAGAAVVVDAGGYPGVDYDTGVHIIAPVLRALDVAVIDAVALTHAHADHATGIAAILERFPSNATWIGSGPYSTPVVQRILRTADEHRSIAMTPRGRHRIRGCDWIALDAPLDALRGGARRVDNDASLTFAVECGRRRLLLTGDAGVAAERGWDLRALRGGVLKVGHHGSDTSTSVALLDALQPRHAVISVGHRNSFGLPRTAVLERLRDRGIAVYRTDRDGAVTLRLGARVRASGQRWRSGSGS